MPAPETPQGLDLLQRAIVYGRRALIWAIFFGVLYILRSFFPLLLVTFVFSYGAERAVEALDRRFVRVSRRVLVPIVFLGSLGMLVGLGFALGPRVKAEQQAFVQKFPEMRNSVANAVEGFTSEHPSLRDLLDPEGELSNLLRNQSLSDLVADAGEFGTFILDAAKLIGTIVATLLLAILLSFLVVLDLPRLRREVDAIQASRVGWLYEEVRGTVIEFGATLGRVIHSQALIAVVNTVLTFVGLVVLGVPSKILLSVIVFLCSFVPVLGVFISTVPICLIAFTKGGFSLAFACVALVVIIHTIEAYVLNPRIVGHKVHMNPVFALVVLFVGEHLFGLWGLVLGVPVAVTLLRRTRGDALVAAPA